MKYSSFENDKKDNNSINNNKKLNENIHNKDKDKEISNEYNLKKNNFPKNKTEFTFDKNINKLVKKNIYSEINNNINNNKENNKDNEKNIYENKEDEKENNKNINEEKIKDNINKSYKTKEKEEKMTINIKNNKNEEKEEKEFKKPKEKLLEYTIEQIKKDKIDPEILKGKDKRVIEITKRIGNCEIIFRKEQKLLKNKEEKENIETKDNNENKNNNKEKHIEIEIVKEKNSTLDLDNTKEKPKESNKGSGFTRFYRKGRISKYKNYTDNNNNEYDHTHKNDNSFDKNIYDNNSEEEKLKQEKENYLNDRKRFRKLIMNKPNNTYNEIVIEKKIIVDSDDDKKSNNYNNKFKPFEGRSKRKQFLNNTNNDDLNNKISTISFEERRYIKRPSFQYHSRPIYMRKKIEEKKPDRNEILIEVDNDNENESNIRKEFTQNYKKNNIRIRMKKEKLDEDDKYNLKNTNLQNYNTNSNYTRFGGNIVGSDNENQLTSSFDKFFNDSEDDDMNEEKYLKTNEYKYLHEGFIRDKPYKRIIEKVKKIKGRNIKNDSDDLRFFSRSQDFDNF